MDWESLLDSVETESDWPKEALPFRNIEKSLKCAICHGTMKTAVMLTKCGHSFCSYCIRQSLYNEQICPLCRKPATESDIVRNVTVNEIADTFREHRNDILRLCNQLFPPQEMQANEENYTKKDTAKDAAALLSSSSSKRSTPIKSSHESVVSDTSDSSYEFEEWFFPSFVTSRDLPPKRQKGVPKNCTNHYSLLMQ